MCAGAFVMLCGPDRVVRLLLFRACPPAPVEQIEERWDAEEERGEEREADQRASSFTRTPAGCLVQAGVTLRTRRRLDRA